MTLRTLVAALGLALLFPLSATAQIEPDPATGQRTITSTTSGDIVLGPLTGRGTATIQLTGTWVGTFPIEGSLSRTCTTDTSGYATIPGTSSLTSNGLTQITVAGIRCIRLPDSGWSSGTVVVHMQASNAGGVGTSAAGGDASAANQTTIIGHVDGLEAALATLDGRVDGLETLITALNSIQTPATRTDTYTGVANGTAIDGSARNFKYYGIKVTGTGASATSWTAEIQVSFDNSTWNTIETHATADLDATTRWTPLPAGALYVRSRVTAVVLGSATNIVVRLFAQP